MGIEGLRPSPTDRCAVYRRRLRPSGSGGDFRHRGVVMSTHEHPRCRGLDLEKALNGWDVSLPLNERTSEMKGIVYCIIRPTRHFVGPTLELQ